ncbi:hypothetical protein RHSIM_Rhsim07G0185800 [Rhododendron simsii]|uniref:Cullin N-terminal domain-containing protein n=1 Tax=Rhododendron simsii TaxID=118357 RepID=A0A834LJP5_RHOSS|nr:hypothetical protein RHSIM_Rhsim07G0185800 [Rhododendron simsii]
MEEAIEKVKRLADGTNQTPFSSEEYMMYFSCAFFFSSIRFYGSYTGILYEKFIAALQDNIHEVILPTLDGKEDVPLLMEIMDLWSKYKILAHWLLRFFEPLRPFCSITRGANISDVPYRLICDGVFDPMWSRFRGAVMRLINQERAGIMVDRDIIKAAIRLFVEVDDKGKRFYYRNFEQVLLTDIDARYIKLAQEWVSDCSGLHRHGRNKNGILLTSEHNGKCGRGHEVPVSGKTNQKRRGIALSRRPPQSLSCPTSEQAACCLL